MEVKDKTGKLFNPFPEPERRGEYQTKRNDAYPDVRIEIRHLPFELVVGIDKIIETVQAEKPPVGGVGVKIGIGKMRHKDVCNTLWLQHSNNLTHQKLKVAYMLQNAGAMDFIGASVGQESQSIFKVGDDVNAGQICLINAYPALFFLCSTTQLQAHLLT
jgi:hypothetical protein